MSMQRSHAAIATAVVVGTIFCRPIVALSMLASFPARKIISSRTPVTVRVSAQHASRVALPSSDLLVTESRRPTPKMDASPSSTLPVESSGDPCSGEAIAREDFTSNERIGRVQQQPHKLNAHDDGPLLARVILAEERWLIDAGARLRKGKLVAFPTETVYGLGANALSEAAVLSIFEAKQRPLTDPLIVHVPDAATALTVVDFDGEEGGGEKARRLLDLLASKLWPGPLTLILRAASCIPSCVTAGTGFVGIRCPAHPVARKLLSLAAVPVAAPSANRFGHVSPTKAAHVMEDLGRSDILVVNGDSEGACGVGIESTVAKIDVDNNRIVILRMGGVTRAELQGTLALGGEEFEEMCVVAGSIAGGKITPESDHEAGSGSEHASASDAEGQAPGQLLKHYSPDLDVYRVTGTGARSLEDGDIGDGAEGKLTVMARTSVVIDFAGQLRGLENVAQAYADLSVNGDAEEAATGLFAALRWAEAQPSAKRLIICSLPGADGGDMAAAVNDRIFRAASGKTITAGDL